MKRRIYFVHSWVHDIDSFLEYTDLNLEDGVELVWDEKEPEILFGSDNIYTNRECNKVFRKLYEKARVTVFYGTEACFTDFNLFDYGLGYDNTIKYNRYVQIPIERFYRKMFNDEPINIEEATNLLNKNGSVKFCNFLYSNPFAHPFRDKLFYAISDYKHVDSLGKHLNNTGRGGTGFVGHYQDMVALKRGYKFSIAVENIKFPGWTSEKIYTSLNAHTIPIYWGNPDVEFEINPNCLINCMKYNSIEDIIEEIRRIDNDDEAWIQMVSSPWHTPEQLKYLENRSKEYDRFMNDILIKPIEEIKQRRIGTYQWYYRNWFLQTKIDMSFWTRLKRRLKNNAENPVREL